MHRYSGMHCSVSECQMAAMGGCQHLSRKQAVEVLHMVETGLIAGGREQMRASQLCFCACLSLSHIYGIAIHTAACSMNDGQLPGVATPRTPSSCPKQQMQYSAAQEPSATQS